MHVHSIPTITIPASTLQSTPALSPVPSSSSGPTQKQKETSNLDDARGSIPNSLQTAQHDPELAKLKARDKEVRAHEAAHASVAGSLANGGPSYTYQRGSDGRLYAVGGEVSIDTSAVEGDPEATIQKARQIRAAANAPANPSAQDRAVAAQASRMEAQARGELHQEGTEDIQAATSSSEPSPLLPQHKTIDIFA